MISRPPLGGGWQREALTGGEKTAYYVSPSVKTFGFDTSLAEGGKTGDADCHDQSADWSRNDTAARCGTRSVDVCRGGVLPRPAHCAKQEGQNPSCLLFHPIAAPVILRSRRPGRRRCYPPARRSPPTAHGSARRPRSSPSPAVPAPPSPSPACCSRHRSGDGGP